MTRLTLLLLLALGASAPAVAQSEDLVPLAEEPAEAPFEGAISLEPATGQDDAIRTRLQAIFAALDGLDEITVEVSSGVLWVAGWVDQRRHDHRKVKSEALRLVKEAFDHAEIDMPEPIYRLRFERGGAVQIPEPSAVPKRDAGRRPRTAQVTVDLSRDAEIDETIAEERADPHASDLLDPAAPRE